MKTLDVGDARVSIINVGDLNFKLGEVDDVPENEWRPRYADIFENPKPYPSQSVFISLSSGLSILVDAGDYALFSSSSGPEYTISNYAPPPTLVDQLGEIGVRREDVNYVVITHAHYDHYAGVTTKNISGSDYFPTFPRAIHLLGREDYENSEMQRSLSDPNSEDGRTLGVLFRSGLLQLVEGSRRRLCDEVEIITSPGETPGHKIVKLVSKGKTLYCLGDLFHHAVEVENPSWMARWDDHETNLKSRHELIKAALEEEALLIAAHMPPGRLERTAGAGGVRYREL